MATGVELATAWIRLVPSFEGAQDQIMKEIAGADKGVETAATNTGKKWSSGVLKGVGGLAATLGGMFVANQIGSFVTESINGLARIETIGAQTRAVIESTGGAANVSAAEVRNLADSLESVTATESEAIQEGANLLLTFKNIQNGVGEGNDIFNQATTSLVDMARAMGTDPQSAAIQLGKALNDPVAGISALSRVGIQFTDDQKAMIESLVESGNMMEAQKIILGELNSQFGGSGAAYAETYQGQLDLLGHSLSGLGETILSAVMPALQAIISGMTTAFTWLSENQPVLIALGSIIGITLVAAFIAWSASIWATTAALLANPVTWVVLGLVALAAVVVALIANWDHVVAFVTDIWNGFLGWIQGVTAGFTTWWSNTWSGIAAAWNTFWGKTIPNVVRGAWNTVLGWIEGGVNGAIDLINGMIGGINNVSGVVGIKIGTIPHVDLPRLADGATILPRRGGTAAILAEAGRPETVVDTGLMNRALEEGLAGSRSGGGRPIEMKVYGAPGMDEATVGRVAAERLAWALREA